MLFRSKQLLQLVLFQLRADDAQPAGVVRPALSNLKLLGHQVEVEPGLAVVAGDHPLGPEDNAVILGHGQGGQGLLKLLPAVLPGRLPAPGGKHLVGVVVVVVMVVAVAAGGAGIAVVVVVFMVMVVAAVAVVIVAAVVMVVRMVVAATVLPVVMVVFMVMVMFMVVVLDLFHQGLGQVPAPLHRGKNLL